MELKILNVYYVELFEGLTNVIKSIEWICGDTSGTLELENPIESSFIDFELITTDILKTWLNKKIDFKELFKNNIPIEEEKEIILVKSFV